MPLLQYLAERISSIPMTMPDTGSRKSWTVLSPRCAMLVTCLSQRGQEVRKRSGTVMIPPET